MHANFRLDQRLKTALKLRQVRSLAIGIAAGMTLITAPTAAQSLRDITVLAASCANCHGTDGRSTGIIPSLAGRPESVLRAQLRAYKSDTPPPATTIMNRLAKGYNQDDLDALARHFSQLPATEAPAPRSTKR